MAQGLKEHQVNPCLLPAGRERKKGAVQGEGMNVKDEANHENLIC